MCLAPHIASLTVPVNVCPLAANAPGMPRLATINRLKVRNPVFFGRAIIEDFSLSCFPDWDPESPVNAAPLIMDVVLPQKLQALWRKGKRKAETRGASPPGARFGLGEGPGKVQNSTFPPRSQQVRAGKASTGLF